MSGIDSFIQFITPNSAVNAGDYWGLGILALILTVSLAKLFAKTKAAPPKVTSKIEPKIVEDKVEKTAKEELQEEVPWHRRLAKGLARSRSEVWGKLEGLFSGGEANDEMLEEIEELLYGSDIGPTMVAELMDELQAWWKSKKGENLDINEFKLVLYNFLHSKMTSVQEAKESDNVDRVGPKVIMIVGVNGAGKTTTIGKLATKLTLEGNKVMVGACDTFRAAAVDQLQVWCDRAGARMIRAKEGSNPSGVGYDALKEAINQEADYCLLDTAGRLHTKGNLMEELKKSKTVLSKLDPTAPHEVWLVLDAITGQNALRQAEEFHEYLQLSGLIFTKCDGSSKAGSAVAIIDKLKVPIKYIGVGEGVEDLNHFELEGYLKALLGMTEDAAVY